MGRDIVEEPRKAGKAVVAGGAVAGGAGPEAGLALARDIGEAGSAGVAIGGGARVHPPGRTNAPASP